MKLLLLPRAGYRRMRWKNGAGWTTEIARAPAGDGDDFDWRVSIAEIDRDCEFSRFDGCDRSLIVLDGNGIELRLAGREPLLLREHGRVAGFAGEDAASCRLLDGPTRDFNVMTRRARCSHKAMFRPLLGPMVVFPEPNVHWLVHVVAGSARRQHVDDAPPINAGDSALIEPDNGAERQLVLSGGGEVILVRFERSA
jgi:hypothetical protein